MSNQEDNRWDKIYESIEKATSTKNDINIDEFFTKYGELYKKESILSIEMLEERGSEFKDRFDPYSIINLQNDNGETILQLPPLFNSLNSINTKQLDEQLIPNTNQLVSDMVHPVWQNEQYEKTELSVFLSQLEKDESVDEYKHRTTNKYKEIIDRLREVKSHYATHNHQLENNDITLEDDIDEIMDLSDLVEIDNHNEDHDIFDDIFD